VTASWRLFWSSGLNVSIWPLNLVMSVGHREGTNLACKCESYIKEKEGESLLDMGIEFVLTGVP